jgi:hypothetical protein
VLLYAHCIGVRSSRRLERRCQEDNAFRVLTANQFGRWTTECRSKLGHPLGQWGLVV